MEAILGWDVIGWIIAFLVPFGLGVLPLNEFRAAKACFGISACILAVKAFVWGITTDQPIEMRSIILIATFGLIGFCAVETFRWVDQKKLLLKSPMPPAFPPLVALADKPATEPLHVATKPPKPDPIEPRLKFVYSKEPALVIDNPTGSIVREIKWQVILWNLDLPDRMNPLPIPATLFDWLRPHMYSAPLALFTQPLVAPLVKPGNRLMGSASVICPECARGRTYIVSIVLGEGGWYCEVEAETSGNSLLPIKFDKETREIYFKEIGNMCPESKRIPIEG